MTEQQLQALGPALADFLMTEQQLQALGPAPGAA
jgi:hypothetical protein